LDHVKKVIIAASIILLTSIILTQQIQIYQLNNQIKKINELKTRYTGNPFTTAIYPGQFQAENVTGMHWYTYISGALQNRTDTLAYPEQSASYIIFGKDTDGDGVYDIIYAKNCTTGQIEFDGTDAVTVINNAISKVERGSILLKGTFNFSDSVITKPGVLIKGEGIASTIINAPSGKPAFKYIQPSGSTSVVAYPLMLKDLTIAMPTSGGPHYAIQVDCSAYGGSRVVLEDIHISGYFIDGTYDKDSANPHIGIDLNNVWNFKLLRVDIDMPGVLVRMTDYGLFEDCGFNGGAYGKAIGILLNAYRAKAIIRRVVSETKCRPVIKSTYNSLYATIVDSHFEKGGWDTDPPEPVIELDASANWEVYIDLIRSTYPAMYLNAVDGHPEVWLNTDKDITHHIWNGQYSIVSGSPTVTVNGMMITVDNSGQATDAVVRLTTPTSHFSMARKCFGGYISGQGEVGAGYSSDFYCAIGIDESGNLYVRQYRSGVIDENVTLTTSGTGEFEVLPISIVSSTKQIVYGDGGVYYSKIASFSEGLSSWYFNGIWITVPAGQTLSYKPLFWRG